MPAQPQVARRAGTADHRIDQAVTAPADRLLGPVGL